MSGVMESQALTDLLARAGASDRDRAAWLAERAQGITATEIRDLVKGKLRQDDLIALKLGRKVDSFTGNQYTDWGNEREAVIAEVIRGIGFDPESRVFHATSNSRHLASPDGIGIQFDGEIVVSEIKTSGKDIRRGTRAYDDTGYELQMQWAMWVTGAERCMYVFEERLPGFYAGQLFTEWVERDETIIAELVTRADLFLAELDRQREDGTPVIDEDLDTHAVNYLRGLTAEKEGAALKKTAYAALIAAGKSQESPLARVTFTPGTLDRHFQDVVIDLEAAEKAHPEETAALQEAKARVLELQAAWDALANQHTRTVMQTAKGSAARVTVTAGKATKEMKA